KRARERLRLHAAGRALEHLLPPRQVHAVRIDDEARAVRQADDGDVEPFRQQILALLVQLPEHRAADVADAHHCQRAPLPGLAISNRKSCSISAPPRSPSAVRTPKRILCSDDACEIRITLTRRCASARKRRSATPGTPTIPGPRSVSSARSPTDVIPFASFPSSSPRLEMTVPGADGLNVFLMSIGICFATAGAIVDECRTRAPKYDSSIASS